MSLGLAGRFRDLRFSWSTPAFVSDSLQHSNTINSRDESYGFKRPRYVKRLPILLLSGASTRLMSVAETP